MPSAAGWLRLPFLVQMSHNYPQWFSIDQLMQMVAVSESTPGAIGVNMASYVGYHVAGIFGSLTATFALILPAFLTIAIVVRVLDRFKTNRRIIGAMEAMRPAVTGLIAAAGYTVLKSVLFTAEAGLATLRWIPLILFVCPVFPAAYPAFAEHSSGRLHRGRRSAWHRAEAIARGTRKRLCSLTFTVLYGIVALVISHQKYHPKTMKPCMPSWCGASFCHGGIR